MSFSRRLTLYLFGFLIGLAVVFVFFGDRLNFFTDWFPNNRVLAVLREDQIEFSAKANCQMECLGLDREIMEQLLDHGEVDFKASNPQAEPRFYVIDIENTDDRLYRFSFETFETTSEVIQVEPVDFEMSCECR